MLKKIISLLLCCVIFCLNGCIQDTESANEENTQNTTSETQKETKPETDSSVPEEIIRQGDPVSPDEAKEFEERAMYLYSEGVYPELWWAKGSSGAGMGEDLNYPLDLQLPETEYYYVSLFKSIDQLKQATEKAVTKEYAQNYLYLYGEQRQMFVEHDGNLYANAYWINPLLWPPQSVTFLHKDGDIVFFNANYVNPDGEPFTEEIQLKLEDGEWKFHRTQLTDFFQSMIYKK